MSGPYPSPGYPQDGQWHGESAQFPTVQYSGLGGSGYGAAPGGPPPRRSTGRTIVAVVSVLVIIGGVATGIVLLQRRHSQHQAVSPPQSVTTSAPASAAQGLSDGTADLSLSAGSCVAAVVGSDDEYRALSEVTCGGADSDLVLAMKTTSMDGCADHQYLRLSTPSSGYYCFTLDIKQGDCVDKNYLKTPCPEAAYLVLRTEPGPGSDSSCTTITGATHWVPVGRDPVEVGCLGPPGSS
jgi:hypothetical protein